MTVETSRTVVRAATPAPAVGTRVTVVPSERRSYLAKSPEQWGHTDLRDFIVYEHERRFGPIRQRDAAKEAAICKRFLKDWQWMGPMIAMHAFAEDGCDGMWRSAPITLERFAKGCDAFFAVPIGERIADAQAASQQAEG